MRGCLDMKKLPEKCVENRKKKVKSHDLTVLDISRSNIVVLDVGILTQVPPKENMIFKGS